MIKEYIGQQNIDRPHGRTELHEVCAIGKIDRVKDILETNPDEICKTNDTLETTLHFALVQYEGKDETIVKNLIDLLLNFGANVNAKNNQAETPIYYAIHNYNHEIVNHLLNNGASILNRRLQDGKTPLEYVQFLCDQSKQNQTNQDDINNSQRLDKIAELLSEKQQQHDDMVIRRTDLLHAPQPSGCCFAKVLKKLLGLNPESIKVIKENPYRS